MPMKTLASFSRGTLPIGQKGQIKSQTGAYILTRPELNPSARILAKELGLQKSYEPRLYSPVIRWGNSEGSYGNETLYNDDEIIHCVANKARFSATMRFLQIPHVEMNTGIPERFPVVIRHSLSGSRGVGIEIVENHPDLTAGELVNYWTNVYWSYWRNFQFELGVHFFDGEIIKTMKKVFDPYYYVNFGTSYDYDEDGEFSDELPEEEYPIRNSNNGYHFKFVNLEKYPKLVLLVRDFCDKFPMKFGRLDIGWNTAERKYEIIEANSAPSIAENENTAQLYIERFKQILERR